MIVKNIPWNQNKNKRRMYNTQCNHRSNVSFTLRYPHKCMTIHYVLRDSILETYKIVCGNFPNEQQTAVICYWDPGHKLQYIGKLPKSIVDTNDLNLLVVDSF